MGHGLPRDVGSWAGTARMARTCQACQSGAIGDEKHLVFECSALQHVRDKYTQLLFAGQTVQQFMWQQSLTHVVLFITDCLEILDTSGLDDEPDI